MENEETCLRKVNSYVSHFERCKTKPELIHEVVRVTETLVKYKLTGYKVKYGLKELLDKQLPLPFFTLVSEITTT